MEQLTKSKTSLILVGILLLIFIIDLVIVWKKEHYYYDVNLAYNNPQPLVLPPNPPTDDWFEPDTYNRPMGQGGMNLPDSFFKGGKYYPEGVGYTDDRAWYHQ